ncbi:MAG TPA: hypothetical protein VL832_16985 [Puia sp.]|nr:hypothetical protein [Puia sp.]
MKKNLLFSLAFSVLLIPPPLGAPIGQESLINLEKENALSCGPSRPEGVEKNEQGKFIAPLTGWGHYSYAVSTGSDSARYYFEQGLTMYYSYHMRESVASFKEAARFDSGCAMAYWGQALAMGPYYNAAYSYKMPAGLPAVLALMDRNSPHATAKEQQLIKVMGRRYAAGVAGKSETGGGNQARAGGNDNPSLANIGGAANEAYALGLLALMTQYPDDLDIKAMYIDAVMLIHPWEFWNNDGSAKVWTPELLELCETLLKKSPHHPAALHYYIHLTEASHHPERAFPNAEALKKLFPGVAHMVHMSSHEYERTGLYAQGVEVNDLADEALGVYDSLAKHLSLNRHSSHYFAVEAYCALSGAMYQKGMEASLHCRNSVTPTHERTYEQYLYMMPALTRVRLGKWQEILQDSTRPDARWPYAGVLYHFARGLALVYTGHPDAAAGQLSQLQDQEKDPVLTIRDLPFNTTLQSAKVAEGILQGAILFARKKYDAALASLYQAVRAEDGLIYREPKDWLIPARQFLGAYLLQMGKPAQAEKVYREDLAGNPGNGWSLLGLSQSLQAQHKEAAAGPYKADYLRSFSQTDRMPVGSVFME